MEAEAGLLLTLPDVAVLPVREVVLPVPAEAEPLLLPAVLRTVVPPAGADELLPLVLFTGVAEEETAREGREDEGADAAGLFTRFEVLPKDDWREPGATVAVRGPLGAG